MRSWIVLLAAGLALTGCLQPDATFGSNYDSCLLRNATQGDDDARSKAEAICARHYERVPTDLEKGYASGRATVTFSPTGDTIQTNIKNRNQDVIIEAIYVEGRFYDGPPVDGWDYSHRKLLKVLEWNADANVEPDAFDTVSGDFIDGGRAPSHFYSAHFEPTKVLPHTGTPQKSLLNVATRNYERPDAQSRVAFGARSLRSGRVSGAR